jgi:hypothetical protein
MLGLKKSSNAAEWVRMVARPTRSALSVATRKRWNYSTLNCMTKVGQKR